MGTIALRRGDVIYLDANALIYAVESVEPYATLLRPVWTAARMGRVRLIGSELLILEALTGAIKSGKSELATAYEQAFAARELELMAITAPVLRKAAELRVQYTLNPPDAIHAATAMEQGCSLFLTNDFRLRAIAAISPVILGDVLNS